ncbi:LEM domain-containing protein 1 isoform X1 [Amphiprion ocellaris]|uniref:LEM domain-containing protein 1 isoform X1 n=2 Tax=Amphiprion ocellaris TaxID=80972 RepID=UPI002410B6CE|nr:LEM domain-containing protein 1 isoform X1 [Amphiprion ocellaris]
MSFVEDPAHLSKSRLKEDLVAHNVELPPAASKKEIYVELHLKNIDQKNAADFSSDEEDLVQDVAEEEEDPEDTEMPDPSSLTDDDLKAMLFKYGVKAGPIVGSTRALYERKLKKLLQSDGHYGLNGAEKAVLYSDSEEEESGSEQQEAVEQSAQQESSQADLHFQNCSYAYPQCFLPSSQLRAYPSNRKPSSKWNSRNALKASERSWYDCTQNPVLISRASPVHQRSGIGSQVPPGSQSVISNGFPSPHTFSITQMVEQMESRRSCSTNTDAESELNGSNVQEHWSRSSRLDVSVVDKDNKKNQSVYYTPEASLHKRKMKEPVKNILKDLFPETKTTPTGIYATCRRPIKGAAQRPIQYAYPDTPISPMTLERREVERRLVPIQIQIFVFLIVVCVVYFLFVNVEDGSFVLSLLDGLSQGSDSKEGLLIQAETQDTQAVSE